MITEGSLDYYWPDHDRIGNDGSLCGSRVRYERIDEVYEFRLDRKRLAGSPSTSSPGEELSRFVKIIYTFDCRETLRTRAERAVIV
jgi:hypothetical protein